MSVTIQKHQSLIEQYGDLCIRLREIQKRDAEGKAICRHCGNTKGGHRADDLRCENTSLRNFLSDEAEDAAKVTRALELIEELFEL